MKVQRLLGAWQAEPTVGANIVEWRKLPARDATLKPLPDDLHPALAEALRQRGIKSLYSHQEESWNHVQVGESLVVVSGTSSGKTLCYNLPVLDRLLKEPATSALYIFPTKALAQDQAAALNSLIEALPGNLPAKSVSSSEWAEGKHKIPFAIYDGDTSSHQRQTIRENAHILLTNPDMLHLGILPHHTRWMRFLRQLRFIVIDEIHVYRGVFGSHFANLIRRLKRLTRFYGSHPQFMLTSATIANPVEFSSRLVEEKCHLIDQDGSPHGSKSFLIYNPPILNRELGLRKSALHEAVRLAEDLLVFGVQTIVFARSRRTVEIILTYLKERATGIQAPPLDSKAVRSEPISQSAIRGYRSGYLPQERRAIERGLRQGDVRVVIATNALELGIDIGKLQAAILVGYPGTIAATWQQAGRAGRPGQGQASGYPESMAILVATADPLDQFLASHPEYLFDKSPEHALINPDNALILLSHLQCAAFELPFKDGDNFEGLEASRLVEYLQILEDNRVLHRSQNKYFWMTNRYPSQEVSLRSASSEQVVLQAPNNYGDYTTIGQVDRLSAYWLVHPQAVYLHESQTYLVEALDMENCLAQLQRSEVDYYTLPRSQTSVELIEQQGTITIRGAIKAHGEILVTNQVKGFHKIRWHTHEQLGVGELDLPPTDLFTTGYWLALEENTVEELRKSGSWRGDPIDYGPNWEEQRSLARNRDDYRCQVCGTRETRSAHAVHHKIPFRNFASYVQANKLDNLTTLCPACHQRVESAVRVRSGLAGLAYVLHNLAPFFLMCDPGDLGVYSDPQLSMAEGNPGVVLYDRVPAGIGFSEQIFELHDLLLDRAHELIEACECRNGCPSCVGPSGPGMTGLTDIQDLGGKDLTLAILTQIKSSLRA